MIDTNLNSVVPQGEIYKNIIGMDGGSHMLTKS